MDIWTRSGRQTAMRGILLHHDTAPAHRSAQTAAFLSEYRVQLLGHPPYSPDLAPCHFFFPKVKEKLRGRQFSNPDVSAYLEEIEDISKNVWRHSFGKWFKRMRRCIQSKGEYVQKL